MEDIIGTHAIDFECIKKYIVYMVHNCRKPMVLFFFSIIYCDVY